MKFYLVGILFILFDIETILLIPWAVAFRSLGLFGFIEGLLFILTLLVGLIYAWKKGIKTIYYIRLRQMALEGTELEMCVSCAL